MKKTALCVSQKQNDDVEICYHKISYEHIWKLFMIEVAFILTIIDYSSLPPFKCLHDSCSLFLKVNPEEVHYWPPRSERPE